MALLSPAFILVRPQMAENIGAAARGMLNFGLTDLRLVAPRDRWPSKKAITMAAKALDGPVKVKVFKTLAEAAADLNILYATTARHRDLEKSVLVPEQAARDAQARMKKKQKPGFVFGPERTGLENDEIALCQKLITIPVNPEFPSLNLAQAVLLIAYEINHQGHQAHQGKLNKNLGALGVLGGKKTTPAPQAKQEELMARLINELDKNQFFKSKNLKPTMTRNIRAMLIRAEWTDQEIRTFHGIISTLTDKKKAAPSDL
ncbi:MAG: RNA methyltransferase [Alphaproteobacteria bacterium]|nr:RNA methyltransferase [Alphaproteobacteria bacterium]